MSVDVHDVAIIGLGPAGAMLAHLLGQHGLKVLVLEREGEIYPLPRAVHFDGEVMRVFETAGLRPQVEAIARPGHKGMYFNNAQGETLLIRAGTAQRGPHGCANNHYFHQPELEAVLREGLRRYPRVQVCTSQEVTALEDGTDLATLQVRDLQSGASSAVQARYVVGCDGARSLTRKVIGSAMIDLGLHQPWLVFDVRLKTEVSGLPEHTVQHCDPARPMTYCNVTGNRRRWEIMLMPGDDPEQLVQPETLWRLVSRWVTPEQADIERAVIYTFHSVLAQTWRKGRLLLAGDSAHQTPPFLGQGMCAAIRDAANLAWKLNAVLRGGAHDRLLDTYGSERAPHVRAFIELAVQLGDIIQTTDPQAARERDAKFRAGQPEIFQFPAPRLGAGVWPATHPQVGQIFPQPMLDNGQLLDTVLGLGFAVIGDAEVLQAVRTHTREQWQALGVVVVPAHHAEVQDWLRQHGVRAVLLRPDRYVAAVADTAAELDALGALWPMAGAPSPHALQADVPSPATP
jgi:3-(3-hydroxy-phenyl)propionate hydroxylase